MLLEADVPTAPYPIPSSVPMAPISDVSRRTLASWARPVVPLSNESAWPATPSNATFWVALMGVDGWVEAAMRAICGASVL